MRSILGAMMVVLGVLLFDARARATEFTLTASTDAGKSLAATHFGSTSIPVVLGHTLEALSKELGVTATVDHAFSVVGKSGLGGMTFAGTADGKPIVGVVFCQLDDWVGYHSLVIYSRADATKADWDKLCPSPTTQASDLRVTMGEGVQAYDFPDGSGSILLAAGYKTNATSIINPLFITGPSGQSLVINNPFTLYNPDSPMGHMAAASTQPSGFVTKATDPVSVVQDIVPQLSKMSQSRGGPAVRIDQILSHEPITPTFPNAKAELVIFDGTRTTAGVDVALRVEDAVQLMSPMKDVSFMFITGINGPKETFEKDKPILLAMLRSLGTNRDWMRRYEAEQRMMRDQEQVVRDPEEMHSRFERMIRGEDAPTTQGTEYLGGLLNDLRMKCAAADPNYAEHLIKAIDDAVSDGSRYAPVQVSH